MASHCPSKRHWLKSYLTYNSLLVTFISLVGQRCKPQVTEPWWQRTLCGIHSSKTSQISPEGINLTILIDYVHLVSNLAWMWFIYEKLKPRYSKSNQDNVQNKIHFSINLLYTWYCLSPLTCYFWDTNRKGKDSFHLNMPPDNFMNVPIELS